MHKNTILVIDDEYELREMLRDALEYAGYHVLQAASGEEGLRIIAEQPVDLVISDVLMPNLGGIDVLMGLRQEHPHLDIILMSGKVQTQADTFRILAEQFGAEHILQKPFELNELLSLVEQSLTNRRNAPGSEKSG